MRPVPLCVGAVSALLIGIPATVACKNRADASESTVRSAESEAVANCAPEVRSDGSGIAATSLPALLARAKNPSCKAKFLRLPLVRQTKGFTCGAASLKSILYFFGDFFAETELQRILQSHKENGTSFKRIMRFVNALNDKAAREKMQAMYGFDSKVDLNELSVVLNDPAVVKAIKASATKSAPHAAVLKGMEILNADAVDIDKLGSLAVGLSLAGADVPDVDAGHRVQPEPGVPVEAHQNRYSIQLFVERRPYRPSGAIPAGCPATPANSGLDEVGQTRGMTMDDLTRAIDSGRPVLALTQAWTFSNDKDYDVNEYEKAWYSGHYVVVVGYDEKNVYYMDPYNMGHYAFLPKAEWDRRWHDYDGLLAADATARCPGGTELVHFGLVVGRAGGQAYDPDTVTKMY